jgi:hypothetical protein
VCPPSPSLRLSSAVSVLLVECLQF